jgi:hypothetical protein
MREYKASGAAPLPGILVALALTLIGAVLMGGVLYAVDHYLRFYLIVLFPGIAGGVAGAMLAAGVRSGKLRNGAITALIALVGAVVLLGTYHFAAYEFALKDEVRQFLTSQNASATPQAVASATDEFLRSETGTGGFLGFLQLEAKQGISITRSSSSSGSGLELKGVWYWVYAGVEFAVVFFLIYALGSGAANEPFNERNQQWFGVGKTVLNAPLEAAPGIIAALQANDLETAGAHLQRDPVPLPRVELSVRQTQTPDPDNVFVTFQSVAQNGKNEVRNAIKSGLITQAELERLISRAVVNLDAVRPTTPDANPSI